MRKHEQHEHASEKKGKEIPMRPHKFGKVRGTKHVDFTMSTPGNGRTFDNKGS